MIWQCSVCGEEATFASRREGSIVTLCEQHKPQQPGIVWRPGPVPADAELASDWDAWVDGERRPVSVKLHPGDGRTIHVVGERVLADWCAPGTVGTHQGTFIAGISGVTHC